MDHTELNSNPNDVSFHLGNCQVLFSISIKNGKPTLFVDMKTKNLQKYDDMHLFLEGKDAEFLEIPITDKNMIATFFEMPTELTLRLEYSNKD